MQILWSTKHVHIYIYIYLCIYTLKNPFPFPETFGWACGGWAACGADGVDVCFFLVEGSEFPIEKEISIRTSSMDIGHDFNGKICRFPKQGFAPKLMYAYNQKTCGGTTHPKKVLWKIADLFLERAVPGSSLKVGMKGSEGGIPSFFIHPTKIRNINHGKVFQILSFEFGQGIL